MRTLESADEMVQCGSHLAGLLSPGDVLILDGPLGAGKTTFTRGLGQGLGVRGPITSPTFVIARMHPSLVHGPSLVHVDAYRVESLDDVDALDLDASLEDSVTVVEWGLGRVEQLSESYLLIRLNRADSDSDDVRTIDWRLVGPNWESRRASLEQFLGPQRPDA